MKRDLELMRAILLNLEEQPYTRGFHQLSIPGRSGEEVSEHVRLLSDAGLIEAVDLSTHDGECWLPTRITNEGYDFLDAARVETLWTRAKKEVLSKTGTVTLEALKVTLSVLISRALK